MYYLVDKCIDLGCEKKEASWQNKDMYRKVF